MIKSIHIIAQNCRQAITSTMPGWELYILPQLQLMITNAPTRLNYALSANPNLQQKIINEYKPVSYENVIQKMVDHLDDVSKLSPEHEEYISTTCNGDIPGYVKHHLEKVKMNTSTTRYHDWCDFNVTQFFKDIFNRNGLFLVKDGRNSYIVVKEHDIRGFEAVKRLTIDINPKEQRYAILLHELNHYLVEYDDRNVFGEINFTNVVDLIRTLANSDINETSVHYGHKSMELSYNSDGRTFVGNTIEIAKDITATNLIVFNHEL